MEFGVKSNVINLRHFKSKSMDYASIPRKRGTLNPLLTYYIRSPATIAGRVWADAQGLILCFFLKVTTLLGQSSSFQLILTKYLCKYTIFIIIQKIVRNPPVYKKTKAIANQQLRKEAIMKKIGITTTIPVEVIFASGNTPIDLNNIVVMKAAILKKLNLNPKKY